MAKISAVGLGTDIGKQILWDFKNYKTTGFKPWGRGVGGANHYNSSEQYKIVSPSAFRSQAQQIAKFALQQMSAEEHKLTSETAEISNKANPCILTKMFTTTMRQVFQLIQKSEIHG